jgi:hypothetical protein
MPKSKCLDSVRENFVANDDRIFDKLMDGMALWVPASYFRWILINSIHWRIRFRNASGLLALLGLR